MKPLQKKINGYINTAIGYALLIILLGLILLIFPELSLDIIRWTLAIGLVAGGFILMLDDIRRQTIISMFTGSLLGVCLFVMGIITIVHPDVLGIIPIILGAYMIISSVMSLRLAASLRTASTSSFYISVITSLISIICGIILITNPFGSAILLTSLIGIVAVIYGISGIIDLIVFRHNMDELAKYVKSNLKVIDGKEVK